MQNNVILSAGAVRVITALQHKNGTYDYYRATIDRIYTYILHAGDEIGMSDTEILHTVRALDGIRSDLKDLAGASISDTEGADTAEHVAAPVDVITMEHVDFSDPVEEEAEDIKEAISKLMATRYAVLKAGRMASDIGVDLFWKVAKAIENAIVEICRYRDQRGESAESDPDEPQESSTTEPIDKLNEPREMLHDVGVAFQRLYFLQSIISEAIAHATAAGEKYKSVISDLNDVNISLETIGASLDAIMAIDPDTYEPEEPTFAQKAVTFLNRAADSINYGEDSFTYAVECAKRAGAGDAFKKEALEIGRSLTNSIELIKKLTDYAPLLENHDDEPRTADTDD